jgi:hypothetical protein
MKDRIPEGITIEADDVTPAYADIYISLLNSYYLNRKNKKRSEEENDVLLSLHEEFKLMAQCADAWIRHCKDTKQTAVQNLVSKPKKQ